MKKYTSVKTWRGTARKTLMGKKRRKLWKVFLPHGLSNTYSIYLIFILIIFPLYVLTRAKHSCLTPDCIRPQT